MTSKTDNPGPACSEIRERIPLFIGGDLDLEVLATVREHLQRCPACTEAAGAAERGRDALVATLRQRGADYRRPALWEGVRTALLEEGLLGDRDFDPALPSRRPTLVTSETAPFSQASPTAPPSALSGEAPRGRLLRRVAMWLPVAAAACALVVLMNGEGSSPGLEGPSPTAPSRISPGASIAKGFDEANAVPVANIPLRRVLRGEEDFGAEADVLQLRVPRQRGKRPQGTPNQLAGYQ